MPERTGVIAAPPAPPRTNKVTNVLLSCRERPDSDGLGGVSIHTAALLEHFPPSCRVFVAYPHGGALVVESGRPRGSRLAALAFDETDPLGASLSFREALEAALVGVGADVLHVHAPSLGPKTLVEAARRAGAGLVATLHDHSVICERYDLLEGGARYCGIPDEPPRCARCLAETLGRAPGRLERWREHMRELLDAADAVVAPSDWLAGRVGRLYPTVRPHVRRIDWGVPIPAARREPDADPTEPLRLAVVGVQATVKGAGRMPALVEACAKLPVEWHVFGTADGARPWHARVPGRIVAHGAYHRRDLARRLHRARIDVVLLPSIGPESFSLALSEVLAAGIPVIASHLGALGERVERLGAGWLFDPWQPASLAERVARLAAERTELAAVARHVRSLPVRDEAAMARDHADLWSEIAATARPRTTRAIDDARALYSRAALEAGGRRPGALERLAASIRHSAPYRDLGLRAIIPEETRKRVEARLIAWTSPAGGR